MRRATGTTHVGRRSPSDPAAKAAYRFVTTPGWPASRLGWNPARIWLGLARSGLPHFFSFFFSLINPFTVYVLCFYSF
jgi:hypothetical protein